MIPLLAPLLSTLAANGLNLLASAVTAKGTEFIEDKLGIKLPKDGGLTPEQITSLKIKEMEHEELLLQLSIEQQKIEIEAEQAAQEQVTSRWTADMASDSYLSKNIRPMVLIFILSVYTLFSLMSAAGWDVNQEYVKLLAQWGMIVMSAYFVGRTFEKVQNMKGGQE